MRNLVMVLLLVAGLLVTACNHHGGWVVTDTQTTVKGPDGLQTAANPVLLDRSSGTTWRLALDRNGEYYWKRIPRE